MKNNRLKLLILLPPLLVTILFIISACYLPSSSKLKYLYDPNKLDFQKNTTYFLAYNIWYQDKKEISAINYRNGKIIPFGTEVEFLKAAPTYVLFRSIKDNKKYKIINKKGETKRTDNKQFHKIFTKENPEKNLKLDQITIKKIKKGNIEVGMPRKAVKLALGPPPLVFNPPKSNTTWVYLLNRNLKTRHYVFKNDRVIHIFDA